MRYKIYDSRYERLIGEFFFREKMYFAAVIMIIFSPRYDFTGVIG